MADKRSKVAPLSGAEFSAELSPAEGELKLTKRGNYLEISPAEEEFFSRARVAKRWDCSEKAVLRCERRLGLQPYRLLRAIKYKLSDILRVEALASTKAPKKFTGLRPDQKAELLRREREEAAK
jgi:hypothetical protein